MELGEAGFSVQRSASLGDFIQTGSGVLVSTDGHILTAAHVVGAYDQMYAGANNRDYVANVIAVDETLDLALLKLDDEKPKGIQALTLAPKGSRKIGQELFAIGYPVTDLLGDSAKITKGIVSSETGPKGDNNVFQMSAQVQPGSSGGPVISNQGMVLGIVTKTLNPFRLALSTGGALPQNVNFAVKAEMGTALLQKADVAQPSFTPVDLSTAIASVVKLSSRKDVNNIYYLRMNYIAGWENRYGFKLLKVMLYDMKSKEAVMRYLCNIDPDGMVLTEEKGIKSIVDEMLDHPIFGKNINYNRTSRLRSRQETDKGTIKKLIPQLNNCVTHLPQGSRNTAKVILYVTPKGNVRYPGLWVGGDAKELISTQSYKQARDCVVPLLRKLHFSPVKGSPRFYVESIADGGQ